MSSDMYKTAILVQLHKESEYLKELAILYPNVNFYLHFDVKSHIDLATYRAFPNIFLIENRVNVRWGGFSQVQATLLLLNAAFVEPDNFFFHLISGEDCILKSLDEIASEISKDVPEFYMDLRYSLKHRHRSRFFAIHSNTVWQRSIVGKILTKINVLLDKILPISKEKSQILSVYGSSWFSMNRLALDIFLKEISINKNISYFFRKRLCPDEHYFQYIAERFDLNKYRQSNNRRFIDLPDNRNHPRYIDLEELVTLSKTEYWMARKVEQKNLLEFLRGKND